MSKAVVLDLGTETVKYGLSGDEAPKEIHTVFAKPRVGAPEPQDTRLFGAEALEKRGEWTLRFPVEQGTVMNWDDMEVFLTHLLTKKMPVETKEHPFIVASQVLTPKSGKERAAVLMFETFECPFYLEADQTVLSLLHSGKKKTGFVLDAGKSAFQAAPVYEGHVLSHTILRSVVGGVDVRDHLSRSLSNRLQVEETNDFREACSQALQTCCYVAQDFELEQQKVLDPVHFESHQKDKLISFDLLEETFTAPEVIFQPSLMGREILGLHHLINNTIKRCDPSIQADMYANILITGKSSLFPGFEKRLQTELEKVAPVEYPIQVSRSLDASHSAWLGGSTLASHPDFVKMCISKDEWGEEGPNLLKRTATERSRRLDWRDVENGVKRLVKDHHAEQLQRGVEDRKTTRKKKEKREDLDGDNEERESGFFLGHQEDASRLVCSEYKDFSLFVTREMPLQVDDLSGTLRSEGFSTSSSNSKRMLERLIKQLHQCVNLHGIEEVDFDVPRRSKGDKVLFTLERDQWDKAARVRRGVRLFVSSVEYAVTQFVEEFRTTWQNQSATEKSQGTREEEEKEKEEIMREVHSFLFRTRLLNHQHRIFWNAPRTLLDQEAFQDHRQMTVVHCSGCDVLPLIRNVIYDAEGLAIEKYGVTGDPIKLFLDGHDLSLDPSKESVVSLPFMIPSYLQFSLMELLKNALRSSVEEGLSGEMVSVHVDTKSRQDKVQISVEDRGRGFQNQEHCEQAQKFFSTSFVPDQPTYTYSGNFGAQMHGLGMGLPLSRLHIESIHGP